MRLRSLSSLVLSLLVFGCAGVPGFFHASDSTASAPPDADNLEDVPAVQSDTVCARRLRDLSVHWNERHYWCSPTEYESKQRHTVGIVKSLADRQTNESGKSIPMPLSDTPVPPAAYSDSMTEYPNVADLQGDQERERRSRLARDRLLENRDSERIPFATAREALGPRGTSLARQLLSKAQAAQRITLRGVYDTSELSQDNEQERERFSVGRSLSVAELWESAGLSQDKITILHHRNDLQGNYVEVAFYEH